MNRLKTLSTAAGVFLRKRRNPNDRSHPRLWPLLRALRPGHPCRAALSTSRPESLPPAFRVRPRAAGGHRDHRRCGLGQEYQPQGRHRSFASGPVCGALDRRNHRRNVGVVASDLPGTRCSTPIELHRQTDAHHQGVALLISDFQASLNKISSTPAPATFVATTPPACRTASFTLSAAFPTAPGQIPRCPSNISRSL